MKKKLLFLAATISLIAIIGATLASCSSKNYDTTLKTGDLEKETSLTLRDDGTFKIMQVTDLHLTTGGSYKQDNETLKWLEEAIDTARPDLVEVTGDAVGSGVKGRNEGLLAMANIFEKKEVYWAYTFGNHDGEHSLDANGKDLWIGKVGKKTDMTTACARVNDTFNTDKYEIFYGDNTKGNLELYELLKGYKYSLLSRSAEETNTANQDFMGVGNYVIDLKDKNGNVKFALFHMDTHGKFYINEKGNTDPDKYIDGGYVGLTDMQVRWYSDKAAEYATNGIKSALYMHVPNYGYRIAYESLSGINKYGVPQFNEKTDIAYWSSQISIPNELQGLYYAYRPEKYNAIEFDKQEGIYAPRWDDGLMDSIAKNPSTVLISVGHDHNNSFAAMVDIRGKENSVMLAYGRTSGVNAWGRDMPIGASMYTINTAGKTAEEIIGLQMIFPTFKYTKLGNR